jgi:hypothetical protein
LEREGEKRGEGPISLNGDWNGIWNARVPHKICSQSEIW